MRFSSAISAVIISTLPLTAFAAAENRDFDYPELVVSPSASERLATEAKTEAKNRWTTHWAIQSSSAMTLLAGLSANSDPGRSAPKDGQVAMIKTASTLATYIGGGWLVATGVMSAMYTPYKSGMSGLAGLSQGNKKDKLAYERYAEEALESPARLACVMKWASFLSNATASGLVASQASNSMTQTLGGLSTLASIAPLLFEHEWSSVYRFQSDYKKRVYGPLTSASFSLIPRNNVMAAVTTVGVEF